MIKFHTGEEMLALCEQKQAAISHVMLEKEMQESERDAASLNEQMRENLAIMRAAVEKGLSGEVRSLSGLSGGDAYKLNLHAEHSLLGGQAVRAVAAAIAVVEVNAAMGRIVAAPTAGASGILPGVLIGLAEAQGYEEAALVRALFTAGAIGYLVAARATIAGADGGCQAETGTAAAMAAAALVELKGGSPRQSLTAAAIALKNVMGLVCDPVAGLVECPCIKRNGMGAVNALYAADLALAGIDSLIPFDEVVSAMRAVGLSMPVELRETAMGGVAATPTAKAIAKRLHGGE